MKQRILLVGDYNRSDFLYVARALKAEADFFFIEYLNRNYLTNKECLLYGNVLYWKDFTDAYDLLEKIKPQKVIFYFIESFNHVALNVASKFRKIPTFHLEHGIRNLNFKASFEKLRGNHVPSRTDKIKKLVTRLPELYDKYKNRSFFKNTVEKSQPEERSFLENYYIIRSQNSIYYTFEKIKSNYRLPDIYISYSSKIFSFHQLTENLPSNYPVKFIGIPYFDFFSEWRSFKPLSNNILFVDQPLYEQAYMGWTKEHKVNFLKDLDAFAKKLGKVVFLKPHPSNDKSVYNTIDSEQNIVIMQDNNWNAIIPRIDTVIGFSSTLLMPFMAMDNICCFSLEVHPAPPNNLYSQFYIEAGVCKPVYSFKELAEELENKELCLGEQRGNKQSFIDNWMYAFDGKSSERLKQILTEDEVI